MLDPSGCGLGVAIGLVEIGHSVRHAGPRAWSDARTEDPARCCRELVARFCGAPADSEARTDFDLVIVVDVFADLLAEVAGGNVVTAPRHARRIQAQIDAAKRAGQVVVIDAADCRQARAGAFAELPHAVLLAREVARSDRGPWRPFPFLYNNVLLWLEYLRPSREWWLPEQARLRQWDWAFCGTLDGARYGERRRRALDAVKERWPALRGVVRTTAPFVDVLQVLQSSRMGIDLPGAGELCFRLHECLALGTPVLQPTPPTIEFAQGLEPVLSADPTALQGMTAEQVRVHYLENYSPRVAAEQLLAALPVRRSVPVR